MGFRLDSHEQMALKETIKVEHFHCKLSKVSPLVVQRLAQNSRGPQDLV